LATREPYWWQSVHWTNGNQRTLLVAISELDHWQPGNWTIDNNEPSDNCTIGNQKTVPVPVTTRELEH